jgi:hypothetical protein
MNPECIAYATMASTVTVRQIVVATPVVLENSAARARDVHGLRALINRNSRYCILNVELASCILSQTEDYDESDRQVP